MRENGQKKPVTKIVERFSGVGSPIRILQGAFKGFQGNIENIHYGRECATVTVSVGGCPASIEVRFTDIELLD